MAEVFGFFQVLGRQHEDSVVLTAGLDVPIGSPIARLAHQITADTGVPGIVSPVPIAIAMAGSRSVSAVGPANSTDATRSDSLTAWPGEDNLANTAMAPQ